VPTQERESEERNKRKENITLESKNIICKLELEKGRVTKMVTSYELS